MQKDYGRKAVKRIVRGMKNAFSIMLAMSFLLSIINPSTVKATEVVSGGGTGHVHTEACYAGTVHTQEEHERECKYSETVTHYCDGYWRFYEWYNSGYYKTTTRYYYCSKHGTYTGQMINYSMSTPSVINGHYMQRNNMSYAEDLRWQCYEYLTTDSRGRDRYCTSKGAQNFSETESYTDREWTYAILYCPKCGSYTVDFQRETMELDRLEGTYHGSYNTTETRYDCHGREIGKRYVKNPDGTYTEGGCVCDKVVTSMTLDRDSYTTTPDVRAQIKATITLLNGTTKVVNCWYNEGTGSGELDTTKINVPQTVTVYVDTNYPYSDTGANKTYKSADVQIMVCNTFNCTGISNGNGSVTINDGTQTEFDPTTPMTVTIVPEAGYHTASLSVVGFPADGSTVILRDVYDTTRNTVVNNKGTWTIDGSGRITYNFEMPTRNVVVLATFGPNVYRLTYDANNGHWGGNDSLSGTVKYGYALTKASVSPPNPQREGFVFGGWYTAPTAGEKISPTDIYLFTTDMTLYAHWFEAASEEKHEQPYDDVVYYPSPVPIEGFTTSPNLFWRRSEKNGNGSGEALIKGVVFKQLADATYYGHWDANHYKIIFDAAGGTISETIPDASEDGYMDSTGSRAEKEVIYHSSYGELPTPVKAGQNFVGWTSADGINVSEYVTIPKDITLIANYSSTAPPTDAFKLEGVRITDSGGHYDAEVAIPSSESVNIEADVVPWNVRLAYHTNDAGKKKLVSVDIFAVQAVSFDLKNKDGQSCISSKNTDLSDRLYVTETNLGDYIEYMTSDVTETTGVTIRQYADTNRDDEVYIGNTLVSLQEELENIPSYHLVVTADLLPGADNGRYTLSYFIEYELLISR
jgi:uncharacterized repeat protein (TIGR02543 family)